MKQYLDLENITKELNEPSLVVLAGPSSSGKTSISLELAANVLVNDNKGVAILNLEMSKDWCTKRLICSDAFTDKDGLVIKNLYVDDTPAITVEEIKEKCVRLKEEKDLGLVVIDYFQLLSGVNSIPEENSEISKSLKALVQELDICVLLLSQLSKTQKSNKPTLEDLKSSKCLVDDADAIFFLNKDSYNNLEILKMKDKIND